MVKYDIAAMHLLLYGILFISFITMTNSQDTQECKHYSSTIYVSHCPPGEYYSNNTCSCNTCPRLHEYCRAANCCLSPEIVYCDMESTKCRCISGDYECSESSADHTNVMLAAQIALIIALIISATAFAVLIFKTCRRRARILRNRLRRQQEQQRDSLSSIQRFVIERLQNRPPRYDDTGHIPIEKPPSYQEALQAPDSESVNEVWYIRPQQDNSEGIDNPVFTLPSSDTTYYENAAYDGRPPDCDSLPFSDSSTNDDCLYPRRLEPISQNVIKDLSARTENVTSDSVTVTVTVERSTKINSSDTNTSLQCTNEAIVQTNKDDNEVRSDLNVHTNNENGLHFQKSYSERNILSNTNSLNNNNNNNNNVNLGGHEDFSEQSTSL